jgi:hypothetical protein
MRLIAFRAKLAFATVTRFIDPAGFERAPYIND